MKTALYETLKDIGRRAFPNQFNAITYWNMYRRASQKLGDHMDERNQRFNDMITRSMGKSAMQVGVRNAKYAPHWVSVDLYDTSPLIDYNYNIHDMPFEDEKFDFIACVAVLEHVEYPQTAIAELYRVLKVGGEIWIEIPMNQPYHPSPGDFWRVTPQGMRIWMKAFEEISCECFAFYKNPAYNAIYFHGRKV